MFSAYGGPFWFAGFIQLLLIGFTFASPLLLYELIMLVGGWTAYEMGVPNAPEKVPWHGYVMVLGLFLASFFTALLNGIYFKLTFLVGFRIRTGLVSAIYRKALRISSNAKKDTTVGEIVNLMSVDAQRFFELVSYVHVLWSGPIIIGIAIYLIWQQLQYGVIAGIVVMLLVTPISGFIATKLRDLQVAQMKVKDERVKSMNEILNGMKVLKLYAWEPSFQDYILEIRGKEMIILKKAAVLNAVRIWNFKYYSYDLTAHLSHRELILYGHWLHF
jgi:ATP-binding cassette, subfamily C (CFTR/MRP), member 1